MAKQSYVSSEGGSHWYDTAGNPKHDADLRVARKEGLYPSPTSIDKDQFVNPFLESWKKNEIVVACIENPRMPHESEEDYGKRIFELSLQKSIKAAEFGKKIHDAVDAYPQIPLDPALRPFIDKFGIVYDKCFSNKIASELVVVDRDLGVAGRTDFIGRGALGGALMERVVVADWKTQNVKKDKKGRKDPAFYDSWKRQLAFYAVAYAKQSGSFPNLPTCVNFVIDSNEPCEPFVQVYGEQEILESYHDFLVATYCWCRKRNYWPAGPWNIYHNLPDPSRPDKQDDGIPPREMKINPAIDWGIAPPPAVVWQAPPQFHFNPNGAGMNVAGQLAGNPVAFNNAVAAQEDEDEEE